MARPKDCFRVFRSRDLPPVPGCGFQRWRPEILAGGRSGIRKCVWWGGVGVPGVKSAGRSAAVPGVRRRAPAPLRPRRSVDAVTWRLGFFISATVVAPLVAMIRPLIFLFGAVSQSIRPKLLLGARP